MSRPPVQVVFGPVITEKAYSLYQEGRYTFRVARNATKPEIAHALEEHYAEQKVQVVAVNTINRQGKARRTGQRGVTGRTPRYKKAVVTLAAGQRLEGLFGSL